MARAFGAEWTKLRSVPSTFWLLMAAVGATIAFGLLVCSAVDTAGSPPGCVPGRRGCGDEDVVLNSLSGAYLGQIPLVALGVLSATSEYATGTIRSTFAAMPWRSGVVLAKVAILAGPVVVVGVAASAGSFLLGQPILHGNGFVPAHGYPTVSITDPTATRAMLGTAIYLGAVTTLGYAVGQITRRASPAIAVVLAVLFGPTIVSLMLADPMRGWVQGVSPMMAGLAVQRTVERADSVPIGQLAGLTVAIAWAMAAVLVAAWLVRRRDA
jgi:ABC-2 type transport system permease protein